MWSNWILNYFLTVSWKVPVLLQCHNHFVLGNYIEILCNPQPISMLLSLYSLEQSYQNVLVLRGLWYSISLLVSSEEKCSLTGESQCDSAHCSCFYKIAMAILFKKIVSNFFFLFPCCSAGIGRTGALITIDVAMGLMERDLLVGYRFYKRKRFLVEST